MDLVKGYKGLTALPSEMDCNHTAIDLPPVSSAVFLIAKAFWGNVGISEEYLSCVC
jgi:hypothetical protein